MPPVVRNMDWPFGTVTDAGGTGPGVKRWGMVSTREGCRRRAEHPVSEMVGEGEPLSRSIARCGECELVGGCTGRGAEGGGAMNG